MILHLPDPAHPRVRLALVKYYQGSMLSTNFWGADSPRRLEWMEKKATIFNSPSPELDEAIKVLFSKYPNFNIRTMPC